MTITEQSGATHTGTTTVALTTIDLARVQPALRAIEPAFGAGVLCPEVHEALHQLDLGLNDVGVLNIVTRAAPMGAVNADVVLATFYNVNPALVETVIPSTWLKASPAAILAAQEAAFAPVLEAALAPLDRDELAELAQLARTAGRAAAANREGRPLFAGLVSLPWPTADSLAIWHAAKLLREHRGDGHIAGLVIEGLRGIDALVIHAAYEGWPGELLRDSRTWDADSWNASVADLRRRGWLTDDATVTLTPWGRERRRWIEDRTDELAAVAYEPLGNEGIERMITLGAKMVAALGDAGLAVRRALPSAT